MGLLEKARYYRMGFREKAQYWLKKWGMVDPGLDAIEDISVSESEEILDTGIKNELDRKIHDMNTLFEISKELNSSLNVDELLQIILLTCMGQLGLSIIAVFIKSDENFILQAQRGLDELTPENKIVKINGKFEKFCEVNDKTLEINELEKIKGGEDILTLVNNLEGKLVVPLNAKGTLQGFILLGSKMNSDQFTDEEKNFLTMLASMAAIAVDNATLYTNLKNANKELDKNFREFSTLYEISKIINSSDDFEEVLKLALETMSTGFGVKTASISIFDDNGNMKINAGTGLSEETINKFEISGEDEVFSAIIENGEPENIPDFKSKDNVKRLFSEEDLEKIDFFISIPLTSSEQQLGLLNIFKIDTSINKIEDKTLKLFSLFASQIAPPILTTKMLEKGGINTLDLFSPLLSKLETEIDLAKNFEVPLSIILIKIQGASGHDEEEKGVEYIISILGEKLSKTQSVFRYGKSKFLLIMPNFSQDETFTFLNGISNDIRQEIKWATIEFSSVNFPEDGNTARELLFKME